MRTLIFLLFIACSWMANAQTKIVGFVKLQSSGNQALPNAEVWAIGAASKPLRFSNTKGYFELEFPSKKAGDVIREVTVTLDGYEVVNKKDLESYGLLSQPEDDPLIIVLCKQGEYNKAAKDYYEIIIEAGESELKPIQKSLQELLKGQNQNSPAVLKQLEDVNAKLENLPQVAEAAADYFAKIDRDQATQLQKNALAELEKGNIQAALDAMPEEVMDKTMADAQQRKKQLETQLAEVNQVIKQSIENYLFKARLYVSTGDYAAAERLYEKAIAADTTNIENIFDYGVFLEDINRYDKALHWLRKVTTARTDAWLIANAWGTMGQVYQETGDFSNAPIAYTKCESIYYSLYQQELTNSFYKEGVAYSYSKLGTIYQAQGKFDTALVFFQKDLKLTEELYRDNPKSESLKNGLAISYSKLGDIYQAQGNFDTALVYFQRRSQLGEELYRDNPKSESLKNGLAISYEKLGDIYQAQGNFDTALVFFEKKNQLNEELYRDNPNNEKNKVDLAISYQYLGAIYQAQGKFDTALVFFQKDLKLTEELYRDNPNNESLKNGLAISYSKLGDIYQAQGNFDTALVFFQKQTKLFEELHQANPNNESLKNGLAISYQRIGRINQNMGNLELALKNFINYLDLSKELARDNPSAEKWKQDLAIAYNNVGEIYQAQGKFDTALVFFQKETKLFEELYRDNPKSESLKNGLAISYQYLGIIFEKQGEFDKALLNYQKFKNLLEELFEANPASEEIKNNLAISYSKLGDIYQAQGNFDTALVYFQRRSQLGEELYRDNPKNVDLWFGLGVSYYKLGALSVELDKTEAAIGYYEQAAQVFRELYAAIGLEQYKNFYEALEAEIKKLKEPANPLLQKIQTLEQQVAKATLPADKVKYQKELVQLLQGLVDAAPDNQDIKAYTANAYGGLAWHALFTQQFPEAEQAARQGITLGGEAAQWIHTNLALALLYQGKYQEAAVIYQQFKGKAYDNERNWTEVFLADLEDLEKAGITHPDVAKVRKLLAP